MNAVQREVDRQPAALAVTVLALWLVTTSPWVSMLRRVPASAGFFDYAHMVLGVVALVVGIPMARRRARRALETLLSPGRGRWRGSRP